MRANQLRLYLSVMAYSLVYGLRRLGLHATHLANAQVGTIRVRLLKIGAQIRVTVLHWAADSYGKRGFRECPHQRLAVRNRGMPLD